MSYPTQHGEPAGTAEQAMRRVLHEIEALQALATRNAQELNDLREQLRTRLAATEREARATVAGLFEYDVGDELRRELGAVFPGLPKRRTPKPPPATLEDARKEWTTLRSRAEPQVAPLVAGRREWDRRLFRSKRSQPTVPAELWAATERLSEIFAAGPALRERYVAEQLASGPQQQQELNQQATIREAAFQQQCEAAAHVIAEVQQQADQDRSSAAWGADSWLTPSPADRLHRTVRIGEFEIPLPASSGLRTAPALIDFPFSSGLAVEADVAHRGSAIDFVRALVVRLLCAVPPGDVRFVFMDPVSLGQSVAEFRHLSEFDSQLVDTKTWTSERDIERRLEELSDHLEVVISTYLRGQFETIDDYNRQAGEVAEPYRILVVFDYPEGMSSKASRQLLSLIENGPRCGVHTILVHDPARASSDDVPIDRLTHSMQRVTMTTDRTRVRMAEPIGTVSLNLLADAAPPLTFGADGRAATPYAQLLNDVGQGTRAGNSGPVTLPRLLPVLNKLISSGRAQNVPILQSGAPEIDEQDSATWWTGLSAEGASAPIGRAGAQDVASLYFSSTEIAGGAIMVGLPRSGKSTALHAAIISLALTYPPEEIELFLVDSKHGVEFKAYEHLPHARMVSIHSERAFSVAVLRSLDAEIERRAEQMKQHTAGKANLTEFRRATGEPMPRIVLIMDEFHEVFEEDDALGQAAFQAFSNIVRQGPFAGVHVVVSSQTMSSMPAMDRNTLSLLPTRVAFMCNEADADLVMGDANREVRALSQQGHGILNPARGEPSRNKPFRGTYIEPQERGALIQALQDKAALNGFARLPRVFDGDSMAVRPADVRVPASSRPEFALGEPFDLDPYAAIALRRSRGVNVLLIGSSDDEGRHADVSVDAATQSCIVDAVGAGMTVRVVDFAGDDGSESGLGLLELCRELGVPYQRGAAVAEVLADTAATMGSRLESSDYNADGHLLVLNGIQRALDLMPEDPYADPEPSGGEPVNALLARVLRDGPDVGIHTVVRVDGLLQFDRRLGRDALKEFEWRVTGSGLSATDIASITESYTESEVRRHQLLIVDHAKARLRRVRAYPKHTSESLKRHD